MHMMMNANEILLAIVFSSLRCSWNVPVREDVC